jgi:6-phospho-beta-glucosidase
MKLAIIGAAGVRTPLIVKECYRQAASLGLNELSLFDIDKERLENIERVTQSIFEDDDQGLQRSLTTDIENALEGADYVITTFRVGGMEGRVIDERVPLSLGVLGQETTGAGGFGMGVRSIPVLLQYISLMRKYCPDAWLINFANPSGMLAEAAITVGGWNRTIGICDAPTEVQRVASTMLNVPRDEIYVDYFGLNHLGWTRAIKWHGKDILPGLIKDIDNLPIKNLLPFSAALIKSLEMIPNEYLFYYYYSKAAVHNILRAEHTRGEALLEANNRLFAQIESQKDDLNVLKDIYTGYLEQRRAHYMQNETGGASNLALEPITLELQGGYADVALKLIRSLQKGDNHIHIVNTLNLGTIDGLPDDCVVEVPCVVGRDMIQPCNVGNIPLQCLGLMARVKAYEQLTIQAAVEGNSRKAIEALTIHPLVADEKIACEIVSKFKQQFGATFLAGAM